MYPRMSWYFIWYSMCSFQGTVFKLCLKLCLKFLSDWLSSHQVRKSWLVTACYAVTVRALLESLFLSDRCSACMSSVQGINPLRGNFGRFCNLPCIYIKLDIFCLIRQPPILPYRYQYSIVGRPGLNRRVRDGNGCVPWAHRHRKKFYYGILDDSTVKQPLLLLP